MVAEAVLRAATGTVLPLLPMALLLLLLLLQLRQRLWLRLVRCIRCMSKGEALCGIQTHYNSIVARLPLLHHCLYQHPIVSAFMLVYATCRPRRPADAGVVVYHKVNGKVVDPRTGQRMRPGQRHMAAARPHTLSFGTVALTAFIGFRVCQLLRRCFKPKPCPEEQQLLLLQQQLELEQQQQQQLPPVVSCGHMHASTCMWAGYCSAERLAVVVWALLCMLAPCKLLRVLQQSLHGRMLG